MFAKNEPPVTEARRDPTWALDEILSGSSCRRPASSMSRFRIDRRLDGISEGGRSTEDDCDLGEVLGSINAQWRDVRLDSLRSREEWLWQPY
ncbi:MAG: hypothetical protein IT428_25425 [Planctomycetaceae bacterium]|nr:hypothetical protein [Planctomycetaceae bacterium]